MRHHGEREICSSYLSEREICSSIRWLALGHGTSWRKGNDFPLVLSNHLIMTLLWALSRSYVVFGSEWRANTWGYWNKTHLVEHECQKVFCWYHQIAGKWCLISFAPVSIFVLSPFLETSWKPWRRSILRLSHTFFVSRFCKSDSVSDSQEYLRFLSLRFRVSG